MAAAAILVTVLEPSSIVLVAVITICLYLVPRLIMCETLTSHTLYTFMALHRVIGIALPFNCLSEYNGIT
jgi:hypothetical protein